MLGLTPSQQKILHFIREFIEKNNYSPSFREIQGYFGFSSLASVHKHLNALKKKKHIDYEPKSARSIMVNSKEPISPPDVEIVELPVIGELQCGKPIALFSTIKAQFPIAKKLLPQNASCYALQIKGDANIDDHILDKDLLIVETSTHPMPGDITLVSTKNGDSFLKRYFPDSDKIYLDDIYNKSIDNVEILAENEFTVQAIVRFVFRDFYLN